MVAHSATSLSEASLPARSCWWGGVLLAGAGLPLSAVMALSPVSAFWRAWGVVPLLAGAASGVLVVAAAALLWTLGAWLAPAPWRVARARALCGYATLSWLLWCVLPPLQLVFAGSASVNTGALSVLAFLAWCRLLALGRKPPGVFKIDI